ncbi:hypothetical protein SDC9_137260 [bioreactor metagenome]|uniref:Uncharacterized protein n=1 Tax=bioreactor metagenome TaxID=1076179 RepID=A0A645DMX3_9ZZZZ
MKFKDPKMEAYFNSLSSEAQNYINNSGVDISSFGDLVLIGEHFENNKSGLNSGTNQNTPSWQPPKR